MLCFALLMLMVGVFRGPCEILLGAAHFWHPVESLSTRCTALSVWSRKKFIRVSTLSVASRGNHDSFSLSFPVLEWLGCLLCVVHRCSVPEKRCCWQSKLRPYSCKVYTLTSLTYRWVVIRYSMAAEYVYSVLLVVRVMVRVSCESLFVLLFLIRA